MNRIEERLALLKEKNEKAFIVYITAGLPDMERCGRLVHTLNDAGLDVLEFGVPFSDPTADGPVIQDASYRSIQKGTTLKKVFDLTEQVRSEGVDMPIVFMLYYNAIHHYGVKAFVEKCAEAGVDGIIVPDLPKEEQEELATALDDKDETILIQLVSPVSAGRIPEILDGSRGFVYCVSAMGVTGQSGQYHREIISYLRSVKAQATIPVMMGFGITSPEDVAPMRDIIDGAIVGSHFINLMEAHDYNPGIASEYVKTFKNNF